VVAVGRFVGCGSVGITTAGVGVSAGRNWLHPAITNTGIRTGMIILKESSLINLSIKIPAFGKVLKRILLFETFEILFDSIISIDD